MSSIFQLLLNIGGFYIESICRKSYSTIKKAENYKKSHVKRIKFK